MAVSANQLIKARNPRNRKSFPMAAEHLYQGTLAYIDASTGYLTASIGASGVNWVAGIVINEVDNSGGNAGDLECECYTSGEFELTGSGLTQASIGDKCYGVDNATISATATNHVLIGRFAKLTSSTRASVELEFGQQA